MTQISFLGHDAAHRQIFKSGRWNDWVSLIIANLLVGMSYGWWQSKHNRHHANPNKVGADPDIALAAIAFTPERATRHRSRLMRWLVAHQGWYFFPILLLEGVSLHKDGISRIISRDKIQRRWVEISFITFRLAGFAALVFLVLPPEKAFAFLGVQLAVFGLYMGSSFAPNHIGMPLVSPKLKLDFLRRQVLMSRNISGGSLISVFMGGLNYQIEHHLFPSMARPYLRKAQPLVSRYCAAQGCPLHPHHALAVLPHRHRLSQHRRTSRQGPVPLSPGRSTPRPLTQARRWVSVDSVEANLPTVRPSAPREFSLASDLVGQRRFKNTLRSQPGMTASKHSGAAYQDAA
jgi:fatty acid desaturase